MFSANIMFIVITAAYEIGVAERLRELGIITARTPVSGTSASALVAVAIACEIDFDNMLQVGRLGKVWVRLQKTHRLALLAYNDLHTQCVCTTVSCLSLSTHIAGLGRCCTGFAGQWRTGAVQGCAE